MLSEARAERNEPYVQVCFLDPGPTDTGGSSVVDGGRTLSDGKQPGRTGRLDREAYFNAAFKILGAGGFQELTVDNLCAELGTTKGSFYHHFAGIQEFTEALVAVWETTVSEIFAAMAALPPMDGLARSMEMLQRWPLQADAALRAWAWTNPTVAAAVRQQEAEWERLILHWLEQFVPDPARCRLLAHLILAVLAGITQLQRPTDAELIADVCLEILRNNVGLDYLPDGTFRTSGRRHR